MDGLKERVNGDDGDKELPAVDGLLVIEMSTSIVAPLGGAADSIKQKVKCGFVAILEGMVVPVHGLN